MGDESERLIAATICLMSCHARNHCPRLALIIERHPQLIARNPETAGHVRETCRRLSAAWQAIRLHDERRRPVAGEEVRILH